MSQHRPEIKGQNFHGSTMTQSMGKKLVYTVPEAGRLLGLGRNAAYDAAKRGDIPTIRLGRLLGVPKGPFHKLLGAEAPHQVGDLNQDGEQPVKESEQ